MLYNNLTDMEIVTEYFSGTSSHRSSWIYAYLCHAICHYQQAAAAGVL